MPRASPDVVEMLTFEKCMPDTYLIVKFMYCSNLTNHWGLSGDIFSNIMVVAVSNRWNYYVLLIP